jgi:hypothetical protein
MQTFYGFASIYGFMWLCAGMLSLSDLCLFWRTDQVPGS